MTMVVYYINELITKHSLLIFDEYVHLLVYSIIEIRNSSEGN